MNDGKNQVVAGYRFFKSHVRFGLLDFLKGYKDEFFVLVLLFSSTVLVGFDVGFTVIFKDFLRLGNLVIVTTFTDNFAYNYYFEALTYSKFTVGNNFSSFTTITDGTTFFSFVCFPVLAKVCNFSFFSCSSIVSSAASLVLQLQSKHF